MHLDIRQQASETREYCDSSHGDRIQPRDLEGLVRFLLREDVDGVEAADGGGEDALEAAHDGEEDPYVVAAVSGKGAFSQGSALAHGEVSGVERTW